MQSALAADGGELANEAVMRLLAIASAAESPTNKWEAITTVTTLPLPCVFHYLRG